MRASLARYFGAFNIDAYITPIADNHLNEFINDADNRVRPLTGFTGSSGTALDFRDFRGLVTDGRYYTQAEKQLVGYRLVKSDETSIGDAIIERKPARVGVDPRFISFKAHEKMAGRLKKHGIELVSVDDFSERLGISKPKREFFGVIDLERIVYEVGGNGLALKVLEGLFPKLRGVSDGKQADVAGLVNSKAENSGLTAVGLNGRGSPRSGKDAPPGTKKRDSIMGRLVGKNVTGSLRSEKIRALKGLLNGKDGLLVTELDTIAWVFNLRGGDLKNNLVFYSYAYITEEEVFLFTNSGLRLEGVVTRPYESFEAFLETLRDKEVLISGECNAFIGLRLNRKTFTGDVKAMQSVKNEAELYGELKSNLLDGIALLRLFEWIEDTKDVTEREVGEKLVEIKKDRKEFLRTSFDSIVGFGPNSAELHHSSTDQRLNQKPGATAGSDMILIDSGSQYIFGTTDITRSLCLNPTADQKKKYTFVLKGVLAAKMLTGDKITGAEVDKAARDVLNNEGWDYASSTGHGVGSGLFVHEDPPQIGGRGKEISPNQIFTIEPGFYEEGNFGVRIEDTVFLKVRNGTKSIVSLTYLPLHRKLVDRDMLTGDEIRYLNSYSSMTRRLLEPLLRADSRGRRYLVENTAPF